MEDRELIKRLQSVENKKHIEIVLLEKAYPIIEDGIKAQKDFASNVLSGLTNEEKRICMSVFDKICRNADAYLKNYSEIKNEK